MQNRWEERLKIIFSFAFKVMYDFTAVVSHAVGLGWPFLGCWGVSSSFLYSCLDILTCMSNFTMLQAGLLCSSKNSKSNKS